MVPAFAGVDWCIAGDLTRAPTRCAFLTAAGAVAVSDGCIAGVLARVLVPCAARAASDRCNARILARASALSIGGASEAAAAAATTASIAGDDAVGVTAAGTPGLASWLRFGDSRSGGYQHDHCRLVPVAHARP